MTRMSAVQFERLFSDSIRAVYNWPAHRADGWEAELKSNLGITELYLPWPHDGKTWAEKGATSMTVGEASAALDLLPRERRAHILNLAASLAADKRPSPMLLPAIARKIDYSEILLLDGSHRAVAANLALDKPRILVAVIGYRRHAIVDVELG